MAEAIEGKRVLDFVRIPDSKGTNYAYPLPLVTGSDFDLSRDTDDTETKDGKISRAGALTAEPKVTCLDTDQAIIDVMEDSMFNESELEYWHVFLDKKNENGLCKAYNMLVKVTEDSQSSDSDDFATREFTLTPTTNITRGYTPLPAAMQALADYVFRGLNPVTESAPHGGGVASTNAEMPALQQTSTPEGQPQQD